MSDWSSDVCSSDLAKTNLLNLTHTTASRAPDEPAGRHRAASPTARGPGRDDIGTGWAGTLNWRRCGGVESRHAPKSARGRQPRRKRRIRALRAPPRDKEGVKPVSRGRVRPRTEEHTSELE